MSLFGWLKRWNVQKGIARIDEIFESEDEYNDGTETALFAALFGHNKKSDFGHNKKSELCIYAIQKLTKTDTLRAYKSISLVATADHGKAVPAAIDALLARPDYFAVLSPQPNFADFCKHYTGAAWDALGMETVEKLLDHKSEVFLQAIPSLLELGVPYAQDRKFKAEIIEKHRKFKQEDIKHVIDRLKQRGTPAAIAAIADIHALEEPGDYALQAMSVLKSEFSDVAFSEAFAVPAARVLKDMLMTPDPEDIAIIKAAEIAGVFGVVAAERKLVERFVEARAVAVASQGALDKAQAGITASQDVMQEALVEDGKSGALTFALLEELRVLTREHI